MVPVFHPETGEIVDRRYIMTRETKKNVLKRRDYYDELLPRMMASLADRTNSRTINRETIDMLYDEWRALRNNSGVRFLKIGAHVEGQGGEFWRLLPDDTKAAILETFGVEEMMIRDDIVNLVMGFRKLTFSNNRFLGPLAPVVKIAEQIWQEIISWERFRIAVLNPAVVLGNIVSNVALLLAQGIPPTYIIRHYREAILGMRKYQRQTREFNELRSEIEARRAAGKSTIREEQKMARLQYYLHTNPVRKIIDQGLFTNIVEEFGAQEDSYRKKLSNALLDKVGGKFGSQGMVQLGQELWMTPGSSTANFALAATQYGDFVGRYLMFKWQTEVKGIPVDHAVRNALSTFIYYNIPQNKYLQWLNDNGFMMFTKFFFRIQPIIARFFSQNPVRSLGVFGAQQMTDMQVMGDSITNYTFMRGLPGKFQLPTEHFEGGDIFIPSLLKWLQVFTGEI